MQVCFLAMHEPSRSVPSRASVFVAGGGEMGARLRSFDWASTTLGPIDGWTAALRVTVDQMLASKFPACLFWGPDLIAIYNDGYRPMLGDKPEALGQPLRVTWSEEWPQLQEIAERAMAGESTFIEDFLLRTTRHGEPEEAFFTFNYGPVFDETGQVVGMLDTVVETTGKVMAERKVRAERDRQQHLLQHMPGFVGVLMGPDHRFEYVNAAYQEIAGGHRTFVGRSVREVFPELVGQGYFEMLDQVFTTGQAASATARPITLDREDGNRFIDLLYEPIRDAQGRVQGIFVGGYDVTERKKAEAALLTTQTHLRMLTEATLAERTMERDILSRIVETTTAQIQVLDLEYKLLAINAACADQYQALFGARPVIGDNLLETIGRLPNPADREAAAALWRRAMAGESFTVREEWGSGDGRRWFNMAFEVLRARDGTQIGAFLTGNDITERVQAEMALDKAQSALRQAQKMEAVGQLTGGIAHDFNNLLAAISGSLQVLRLKLSRGIHDGLQHYVEMGETSVRRAATLTQRLLAFSRRQTLDPQPTDVNRLVDEMAELVRRTVGPSVQVRIGKSDALWATRVDASQLESSLLNLCINARDAMMPLGGQLTITTHNTHLTGPVAREMGVAVGDYVSVAVEDSGVGIPPEEIGRIFEPFYTTKPVGQGTGLGLSMVYGFVHQSEGTVHLESEVGVGTTVRLYLPRHLGTVGAAPAEVVPSQLVHGDGETVLLVEDEEALRSLTTEVLMEAGYRVLQASDGPGGLRHLQGQERVDILVTDVGLPGGLNGRQVAEAARLLRPGLKVLFVTGYAEMAAAGDTLTQHGMAFMTKPFDIGELAGRVKAMIAPEGMAASSSA